jgi:hypothetical protein
VTEFVLDKTKLFARREILRVSYFDDEREGEK